MYIHSPLYTSIVPEAYPESTVPYEMRPPLFYMRIGNIVSKTAPCPQLAIQTLPPSRPHLSPIIQPASTQNVGPHAGIHPDIISMIQRLRERERLERIEQMHETPPKTTVFSQATKLAQTFLNIHICQEIGFVMNRGEDITRGIWYPQELQEILTSRGQELPSDFLTGYLDSEFFEKKMEDGNISFTIRRDKKPSEGLAKFFAGPTIATCGMTTIACAYKAMLDYYGPSSFDLMFTDDKPFIIEDAADESFFEQTDTCLTGIEGTYGNRPVEYGNLCRFENVPWYKYKHPSGCGEGLNCICMGLNKKGEQVFGGLGLSRPSTEGEIYQWLIDDYNQPRNAADYVFIRKSIDEDLFPQQFDPSRNKPLALCDTICRENPRLLQELGLVSFHPGSCFRIKALTDIDCLNPQQIGSFAVFL